MFIKKAFLKFDLTSAPASLRIKGETAYETICGAIASLITLLVFTIFFVISAISLYQLQNITQNTILTPDFDPKSQVNDFYFMLGLMGLQAYQLKQIIEFSLIQMPVNESHSPFYNPIMIPVQLSRCNQTFLKNLNVTGIQFFIAQNNLTNYYCPPFQTPQMLLSGSWLIGEASILILNINKCVNSTANNFSCADSNFIDEFISNITDQTDFILINLLLIDTIFTPTEPTPIIKTVKADTYITFGPGFGSRGTLQIFPYLIETDQSFFPWSTTSSISGYYIQNIQVSTVQTVNGGFLTLMIYKSLTIQNIQRQLGKVTDLLSYVGGLFALIFVVVQFFIAPYNQFKYELLVAENSFSSEVFEQYSQSKITFFTYLKIKAYLILNDLNFKFKNSQKIQKLDKIKQQASYLLDARLILKRLNHLENKAKFNFSEDQQLCLDLMKLPEYAVVKHKRKLNLNSQIYNLKYVQKDLIQENNNTTNALFAKKKDGIYSNNQIHPQLMQNQSQINEISSSDQEDNQILEEIKRALKKFKQKKLSSKFERFYGSLTKTNKINQRLKLFESQEMYDSRIQQIYDSKIQNVISKIQDKVCQICKGLYPDLVGACSHFLHIHCFNSHYENLKKEKFKSIDNFMLSDQLSKQREGQSQLQVLCPICGQNLNPAFIICEICQQNWQQFNVENPYKKIIINRTQISPQKNKYICKNCSNKHNLKQKRK